MKKFLLLIAVTVSLFSFKNKYQQNVSIAHSPIHLQNNYSLSGIYYGSYTITDATSAPDPISLLKTHNVNIKFNAGGSDPYQCTGLLYGSDYPYTPNATEAKYDAESAILIVTTQPDNNGAYQEFKGKLSGNTWTGSYYNYGGLGVGVYNMKGNFSFKK
jgi:hypothetical protein